MIIGICGKAQSGKDTLAQLLETELKKIYLNDKIKIYHFADELKRIICDTFKIDLRELNQLKLSDERIKFGSSKLTVRQILQNFGTDAMQKIDKLFWVKLTLDQIKKDRTDIAIISDLRFIHELKSIYNKDNYLIRLYYDNQMYHISETELNDIEYNVFNYHIDNHNHLANLQKEVNNIVKEIRSFKID